MMHVDEVLMVLLASSTQHFLRQVPLYGFSTLLNPKLRHSLSLVSFGNLDPRLSTDPHPEGCEI